MRTVLVDAVALERGGKGVARYLRNVVPLLLALGDRDVRYLAAVTTGGAEELPEDLSDRALLVAHHRGTTWEQRGSSRVASDIGASLVFRHAEIAPMLGPPAFLHVPEDPIIRWRSPSGGPREVTRRLYEKALFGRSVRKAVGLVFSTRATADSVLERVAPNLPYAIRPLGVDPVFLDPDPPCDSAPAWAMESPYLFHLGSDDPRDQTLHLIRSYLELATGEDLPPLVIAGSLGKDTADARDIVGSSAGGHVRLLGRISDRDLVGSYRLALGSIAPSSAEGFGLQPLEALACGSRVIASDTPSAREVLGPFADYISSLEAHDLRPALHRLLEEDSAEAKASRIQHASGFRWDELARGLDEDVRGVLERL
jgi:glycosyltransferase involved in cell wall biosynthesis